MPSFEVFRASDGDIHNFDTAIKTTISKLKILKAQNPDLSNAEVYELYKSKNIEFLNYLLSLNPVRSDTYRLNAINKLLDTPFLFQSTYNSVIRDAAEGKVDLDDISGLNFSLNAEDCMRTHMIDSIHTTRKDVAHILDKLHLSPLQVAKISLKSFKTGNASKETLDVVKYLKKSESERCIENTKLYKSYFEDKVRKNYITTLLGYYSHFKQMGFIDDYLSNQNKKFPDDLCIKPEELDEFFTEESLNNLSITELSALYAYYANRYTKELQRLEVLNFCLSSNYDIDQFMEAENPEEIIPEFKKAMLINEKEFISDLSEELLARNKAKVMKQINFLTPTTSYSTSFDLVTEVPREVKEKYMKFFGRKEKEFYHMMQKTFELKNHTVNQYSSKDSSMLALLSCITANPNEVQNWGIILNENGTINLNHEYQLLGFDIKGLNMPLRLHLPTDMIIDFARENLNSSFFPIYLGGDDFMFGFQNLPAAILTKQPKRIKDNIEHHLGNVINPDNPTFTDKLYSHLNYIANPSKENFPNHLRTKVTEGKKGKKKTYLKHVKQYVSLKTKEILTERQLAMHKEK